jgi:methanogenic corrinoid protein MtbC1
MPDYALMNQLLFEGKHEPVKKMTEEALAEGRPAMEVLEDGLIGGMRVVGEDFKHNRCYFEVLLAARAMKVWRCSPPDRPQARSATACRIVMAP